MMDRKRWTVALAAAAALTGCATTPEQRAAMAARQAQFEASRPTCIDQRECEAAWNAARNWVNTNCGMKIVTMTDSYIETFNSTSTLLYCRVSKEPRVAGGYVLTIFVTCGNPFGCYPDPWQSAFNFNQAVSAAAAPFKASPAQ